MNTVTTSSWGSRLYRLSMTLLVAIVIVSKSAVWLKSQTGNGVVTQPFYLERASYQRDHAGALTMYRRSVLARSHDGKTAYIEDEGLNGPPTPSGVKYPPTRKVTMMDGSFVELIDNLRLRAVWPKMASAEARQVIEQAQTHDPTCGFPESMIVGHEDVAGQRTIKVVRDGGAVRHATDWYAPELGCQWLQSRTTLRGDEQMVVENRLLNLVLGEPDARFFDLGSAYREVTATELLVSRVRVTGIEPPDQTLLHGAALDRERSRVSREPSEKQE